MKFRLPEEFWCGKNVKFSHLQVFGCVSYAHSKLDASPKYIFSLAMVMRNLAIGFGMKKKIKIIKSRNVIFNE